MLEGCTGCKILSHGQGIHQIGGARQHNLKNLSLSIPRDKLVVITGLSGSGKSSLAFDTIYAEGQRKYVESLSAYARQFLDQMEKPEVDFIEGLSPAIAIEQRGSGTNPRSIIATTTEIYDYLRLLFANVGQPHCPVSGQPISRQTTSDIVDKILALPPKTRVMLLARSLSSKRGNSAMSSSAWRAKVFVRARVDGELVELSNNVRVKLDPKQRHTIEAVVDRLVIDDKIRVRLSDSVETALKWGEGRLLLLQQPGEDARPGAISGRNRCIPIAITVRPPARVLIRRRRNIFPSTRRWGRARSATAWGRNWFSTST
jgi:excinuclease ABC subunit A